MKPFRYLSYVLIVIGAMIITYFTTAIILEHFNVPLYSIGWFVFEIFAVVVIGIFISMMAPSIVSGFLWIVSDFSSRVSSFSTKELVSGTIGLVVGLLIAFLISLPLANVPFGEWIALGLILFLGYSGLLIGLHKMDDIEEYMRSLRVGKQKTAKTGNRRILGILDTSAIIDGRFADVYRTGFLDGTFILPEFVLDELKRVADSSDPLKKERGRRGLNILNELREEFPAAYVMEEKDYDDIREVDTKIIRLAVDLKTKIFTNDYNLNRMAKIQNVTVLNINDLAKSVKSIVLPGEELTANIIKAGKEENQGVAFLDDGTMIVVENGEPFVGFTLQVIVTSALQTSNGKMIFAKPKK